MITITKANKTVIIQSRTFGGYRVFMYDSYFETENETYVETLEEANKHADFWLTSD